MRIQYGVCVCDLRCKTKQCSNAREQMPIQDWQRSLHTSQRRPASGAFGNKWAKGVDRAECTGNYTLNASFKSATNLAVRCAPVGQISRSALCRAVGKVSNESSMKQLLIYMAHTHSPNMWMGSHAGEHRVLFSMRLILQNICSLITAGPREPKKEAINFNFIWPSVNLHRFEWMARYCVPAKES